MNEATRSFEGAQGFGAAVAALDAELDWVRLGRAYCTGDARGFFDEGLRARILETGLQLADDAAGVLVPESTRRTLYFGAAVAEIVPILAEHLVLGREIVWLNLAGDETDELVRALKRVGESLGLDLPHPLTESLDSVPEASCDHLWMVSVLTDPDAFPALHDELYERTGSPLATGRGLLADDRARAEGLATSLLQRATSPFALTTTDEELGLLRPLLAQRGQRLDPRRKGRLSAIVGDLVSVGRVR